MRHVETCNTCEQMKIPKSYATSLFVPQSCLFDVFSVDIAEPLPRASREKKVFLVCVANLTGWPVPEATERTAPEEVKCFMKERSTPRLVLAAFC